MTVIDLTPPQIPEPDWRRLLTRKVDREVAAELWRLYTTDMRGRDILSPVNAHAVQRLVLATLMHDRAAAKAMRGGPVNEPKPGNARAIPRPSLYFAAMREAGAMAAQLEADLGLSPRTRDKVGKVPKPARQTGADRYLNRPPPGRSLQAPTLVTPEKEPTK
jgi:hypothetical protein